MPPIEFRGFLGVLLILLERLADHIAADQQQQTENNPVIYCRHIFAERGCCAIPDNRKQRLKPAKPESGFQHIALAKPFDGQAFADGNGKGVHGNGNGDEKRL